MLHHLAALLQKLNGAKFVGRRVASLSAGLADVDKRLVTLTSALESHHDWLQFVGFPAPVYIMPDGALSLKREFVDGAERAVVVSIPKSGTYLMSAILARLGMINTEVHVWETGFSDYRGRAIPEMVHLYTEFTVNSSLDKTAALLLPGQYIVGHVGCEASTRSTLAGFRRFMTVRELRQCLVSNMRWFANEGRGIGRDAQWKNIDEPRGKMRAFLEVYAGELLTLARHVVGWIEDGETLCVRFERLLGDEGESAQTELVRKIAEHLHTELSRDDAVALLKSVLNQPTKTWSGKRSTLDNYWDQECEAIFLANGGQELNERLGYGDQAFELREKDGDGRSRDRVEHTGAV